MRRAAAALAFAGVGLASGGARGQGHGPVFALSTPTLRQGGWSLDAGFMGQVVAGREMAMFRPMLSFGLTENVQLSASIPVPILKSLWTTNSWSNHLIH